MKFSFKLEEIKYIKISYRNSEGFIDTFKAAMKSLDDQKITTCAKFKETLDINAPQEVDFSVICNDGIYKTKTVLKSIETAEPYVFFILQTPEGIEYQQNREYFRVPVEYNCIYRIRENYDEKEYSATTADISANGVSINLPNHIISENLSELIIDIDGIKIVTKVRYIRSEKTDNGYRISFMFSKISELDRDLISQVCIKKQLEEKRKSLR